MRIISGICKGRKIKTPKGMDTRPTQDRVRETMFNVLQNYGIYNRDVLDLFAGTGALGIEALSRGAKSLVAVDMRTAKLIKENLELCKLDEKAKVLKGKIKQYKEYLSSKQFDLVFSDPPYLKGGIQETIELLEKCDMLRENAIIVLEYDKKDEFVIPSSWGLLKEQQFGYTKVSYYVYQSCREENASESGSLSR